MEDMFVMHCNKCYRSHEPEEPNMHFHLTRCHHIVCGNCINSSANSVENEKKCPVCERPFQGVSIAHAIPSNVANYFEDPRKFLQLYKKVSKFQSEQRASLMKHVYDLERIMPEDERILNGYTKLEAQLTEEVEKEKRRIAELRNYIEFYERRDKTMYLCPDGEGANISYNSSEASVRTHNLIRPRTPSLSATDTDVENEVGKRICAAQQKASQVVPTTRQRRGVLNDDFFF